jgi:3-keto-disaccharide hydrolase
MKASKFHLLIVFLVASVSVGADSGEEWVSLFNGKDLTGWTIMNDAKFTVTNGVVHLEKSTGWLRTDKVYTNFVFEAQWRGLEANFNSGLYIRAGLEGNPHPTNAWQVNLKQSAPGQLLRGKPEVLPSKTPPFPVNEWVTFRMEARGKTLTLAVNGQRAWEFDKLDVDHGYIGIQAEGRSLDFRNLRVREIADGPAK